MNTTKIRAWYDGAAEPNPAGEMGFGVVIMEVTKELYKWSGYGALHEGNSNNVAEYIALENTLDYLIENGHIEDFIEVYSDSMLTVKQMNGSWKIKNGRYKETALRCLVKFKYFNNLKLSWIRRDLNTVADELSKIGLNSKK